MIYYSIFITNGVRSVLFFRSNRQRADEAKEREIRAIRKETFEKIEVAHKSTKKLNKLLDRDGDIARMIFLASPGGSRRHGR